jgi:hypothetical protein
MAAALWASSYADLLAAADSRWPPAGTEPQRQLNALARAVIDQNNKGKAAQQGPATEPVAGRYAIERGHAGNLLKAWAARAGGATGEAADTTVPSLNSVLRQREAASFFSSSPSPVKFGVVLLHLDVFRLLSVRACPAAVHQNGMWSGPAPPAAAPVGGGGSSGGSDAGGIGNSRGGEAAPHWAVSYDELIAAADNQWPPAGDEQQQQLNVLARAAIDHYHTSAAAQGVAVSAVPDASGHYAMPAALAGVNFASWAKRRPGGAGIAGPRLRAVLSYPQAAGLLSQRPSSTNATVSMLQLDVARLVGADRLTPACVSAASAASGASSAVAAAAAGTEQQQRTYVAGSCVSNAPVAQGTPGGTGAAPACAAQAQVRPDDSPHALPAAPGPLAAPLSRSGQSLKLLLPLNGNDAVWRGANVAVVEDASGCEAMLHHLRGCGYVGLDTEHADDDEASGNESIAAGNPQQPAGKLPLPTAASGRQRPRSRRLALLQIAAPQVHGRLSGPGSAAMLYLLDVLQPTAAAVLAEGGGLRALLEDGTVTKVVHDAREVSGDNQAIRWLQGGIFLFAICSGGRPPSKCSIQNGMRAHQTLPGSLSPPFLPLPSAPALFHV